MKSCRRHQETNSLLNVWEVIIFFEIHSWQIKGTITHQRTQSQQLRGATAAAPNQGLHLQSLNTVGNFEFVHSTWTDSCPPELLEQRRFSGRTFHSGCAEAAQCPSDYECNEATKCFIRCPLIDPVWGRFHVSNTRDNVWLKLKKEGQSGMYHRGWLAVT